MTTIRTREHIDVDGLDQAATTLAKHLMDVRDALTVLFNAVAQLQAQHVIGTPPASVVVPGLIDANVQAMVLDRLLDIEQHAEAGLDQARSIINT